MNVIETYDLRKRQLREAEEMVEEWFNKKVEKVKTEAELQRLFDRLPYCLKTNGRWYFALETVKSKRLVDK